MAHEKAVGYYNSSARRLPQLKIGSRVDLQDPATGLWNRVGVIVGVGQRRTYLVKTASGRVYWRNRRFLRPYRPLMETGAQLRAPAPAAAAGPPVLRRSNSKQNKQFSSVGSRVLCALRYFLLS